MTTGRRLPTTRASRPSGLPLRGLAASLCALASACTDVVAPTPPARIDLDKPTVALAVVGDTARVSTTVRDAFGNVLDVPPVWHSEDTTVVTVRDDGLVQARGPGTTRIIATAGPASAWATVTVAGLPTLLLDRASTDSASAVVATRLVLKARVTDESGAPMPGVPVGWEVDAGILAGPSKTRTGSTGVAETEWSLGTRAGTQGAVASVESREGTVSVSFTARALPGPAVTATLEADSVLLSGRGETARLSPTLRDVYGNAAVEASDAVSWSSVDQGVVALTPDGVLTGLAEGATTVHARVGPSVTDSIRVEVARRGAITLTFDDGWRSVYENAWPVIRDFPWLRANVGVYTEAVGWPGYLTEDHLDELHEAGWSMVSHTVSHDSLSTLTPGVLEAELRDSQAWLRARGYRGADIFIAPYHDFPDAERAAAASYYRAARGASAHATVPETLLEWMPDAPHRLTGIPADDLPYTTAEGRDRLRGLLQRTVDEGAFLDVFLHQVPPENVVSFRALLEVLGEFRDRVLPYHELFPAEPRTVR